MTNPFATRTFLTTTTIIMTLTAAVLATNTVLVNQQTEAGTRTATVQVDGQTIYVGQDGPAGAPALVLIHGLGGSSHWWDTVTPILAKAHHVIRIDLLGHGRSGKPSGDVYSIPSQATLVGDALHKLGVTHPVVVGHSTGGYVATALAEHSPDLVAALVLVDTGPDMSAFVSSGPVGNLLFTPVLGQLIWRVRTDGILRKGLSSAFSRAGYQIPQQLVDDVHAMTYHSLTATSQASDDYLAQQPLPGRLGPLGKPMLVLYGAEDHRWQPASFAKYQAVPGARVEMVTGVGHSPMLEDPVQTASLMLAFLRSVEPSAP